MHPLPPSPPPPLLKQSKIHQRRPFPGRHPPPPPQLLEPLGRRALRVPLGRQGARPPEQWSGVTASGRQGTRNVPSMGPKRPAALSDTDHHPRPLLHPDSDIMTHKQGQSKCERAGWVDPAGIRQRRHRVFRSRPGTGRQCG